MSANQIYTPADVQRYYDEWTERYLNTSGDIIQGARASSIEELLGYTALSAGFEPGDRILDAGCGVAGPAIFFAQKIPLTIEGLTISGVQKGIAESKIDAAGLSGKVKITQGDYHELDKIYPADYFDRAVFLESLGHAANPPLVLKSAYQVVKDRGHIYIKDFFVKETYDESLSTKIRTIVSNINKHYKYNTLDLGITIHGLRSAGWHIVYIRRPNFVLNADVAEEFAIKHNINILEGVGVKIDHVEWLEIMCQKVR